MDKRKRKAFLKALREILPYAENHSRMAGEEKQVEDLLKEMEANIQDDLELEKFAKIRRDLFPERSIER